MSSSIHDQIRTAQRDAGELVVVNHVNKMMEALGEGSKKKSKSNGEGSWLCAGCGGSHGNDIIVCPNWRET